MGGKGRRWSDCAATTVECSACLDYGRAIAGFFLVAADVLGVLFNLKSQSQIAHCLRPPVVCEFFVSRLQIQVVLLQRIEKLLHLRERRMIQLPVPLLGRNAQI